MVHDEAFHEFVRRMMIKVIRSIKLHDLAVVQYHDPVGQGKSLFLVMGDIDYRDVELLLDFLQLASQDNLNLSIKGRHWLVEQDDIRIQDKRPCDGDPLLLPTAQVDWLFVDMLVQLDNINYLLDLLVYLLSRYLSAFQRISDVLIDIHVRKQRIVLENDAYVPFLRSQVGDILAELVNLAGRRPIDADEQTENSRLAAARRTKQRQEFPFAHIKRYVLQYQMLSVFLTEVFNL